MSSSATVNDFNRSYLQSVGKDGQYNRDRLFKQIGVQPTARGDYSTVHLSDQQRKQMKALLEQETGQSFDGLNIDTAGNLNEPEGFKHELKKWGPIAGIATAGVLTGGFGLSGLLGMGGGSAAAGGGAAASTAAGSAGSAGAAGAAGGGMGLWNTIRGFLGSNAGQQAIQTGAGLASNIMQNRAQGHAVDAQSDAADKALAWEKELYANDQRDYEPYKREGEASIARLSELLKRPVENVTADSNFSAGRLSNPAGQPVVYGKAQQQQAGSPRMVSVQSPDGSETRQFMEGDPRLEQALAKGGKRL